MNQNKLQSDAETKNCHSPWRTLPGEANESLRDWNGGVYLSHMQRGSIASITTGHLPSAPYAAIIDGIEVPFRELDQKFAKLSEVWKKFNHGKETPEYNHAAYMQIIGMGNSVVPILMRRLNQWDGDWIVALKYITGRQIHTPQMRGNFRAIREAWLKWGNENAIRTEL